MKNLVQLVCIGIWVFGVVLAKGFWLTTLSVVIPFYAWYLVAEAVINGGVL